MTKDRFRHLLEVVVCPFCGDEIDPAYYHLCPQMNEVPPGHRSLAENADRWANRIAFLLVFIAAVYFTAHLLVAAGVGRPC